MGCPNFSVVIRNGNTWGPEHTALSAATTTVLFASDEFLTGIEATVVPQGWIDALVFFTNKKKYGPYGTYVESQTVRKHCDPSKKFAYMTGMQGWWYNSISFHFV